MNNAVNDCIGISKGFKAIANKHNIPLTSLKNSLKKIKQNYNDMDLDDADNDISRIRLLKVSAMYKVDPVISSMVIPQG
jgi:hypothetical protein